MPDGAAFDFKPPPNFEADGLAANGDACLAFRPPHFGLTPPTAGAFPNEDALAPPKPPPALAWGPGALPAGALWLAALACHENHSMSRCGMARQGKLWCVMARNA